jgi:signal peptidase I
MAETENTTSIKNLTLEDVLDFVKDLVVIIIIVLTIRAFIFMPV